MDPKHTNFIDQAIICVDKIKLEIVIIKCELIIVKI